MLTQEPDIPSQSSADTRDQASSSRRRGVRFPDLYCWYILASTLDIIVTFVIVEVYKGGEANQIAAAIFHRFGWPGMIALKYASVLVVIGVCEVVARKNERLARGVAKLAVIVGAFPVLYGAVLVRTWAAHA